MIKYEDVLLILASHDPIGIMSEKNVDEYKPEAKSIAERINQISDGESINNIVYEEFVRWFGVDTVGERKKYARIAADVLALIKK